MSPTVFGRPVYSRRYLGAWIALGVPLLVGIHSYLQIYNPSVWPPSVLVFDERVGANYEVYYHAAEAALAGEDFYDAPPPHLSEWYTFLYPPIAVVFFYPTLLFDPWTGYWLFLGLNLLAAIAIAWLLVRYVESMGRRLGWLDAGLIAAFAFGATHSTGTIFFGNVNLLLVFAIAAGFYLLETDGIRGGRWAIGERVGRRLGSTLGVGSTVRPRSIAAGVVFALAALVKPFVALVGLYLLRLRSIGGVLAAGVTGIGGIAAGLLLFGRDRTEQFFFEVVPDRSGTEEFVGGLPPDGLFYVTIQRPLSYLLWTVWPDAPTEALLPLSAIVLGAVLAFFYWNLETRADRLLAIYATLVVTVTLMTGFRHYVAFLYFPLVAMVYVWAEHPVQPFFVVGSLVMAYTNRPGDVLETLAAFPEPVVTLLQGPLSIATMQLYGIAICLLGAAVYKLRYADGSRAIDR